MYQIQSQRPIEKTWWCQVDEDPRLDHVFNGNYRAGTATRIPAKQTAPDLKGISLQRNSWTHVTVVVGAIVTRMGWYEAD